MWAALRFVSNCLELPDSSNAVTERVMDLFETKQGERIKELEAWILECRDSLLYPLAMENSRFGRIAEVLGSSTHELFKSK